MKDETDSQKIALESRYFNNVIKNGIHFKNFSLKHSKMSSVNRIDFETK